MEKTEKRACPVCGDEQATLFAKKHLDETKLGPFSFASRKQPEFMRLELAHCQTCDLVYAPNPLAEEELGRNYEEAAYDSAAESALAARSYATAIGPFLREFPLRGGACEVGAGNGAFLPWLKSQGFERVIGIEPSRSAIDAASPEAAPYLRQAMFDAALLQREKDDAMPQQLTFMCSFMTLEHMRDPGAFAQQAWELLAPGGMLAVVTHDWQALPNRLLGLKSPIIDIEHMQLFCRRALETLFKTAGFERISISAFQNTYPLRYWLRLLPLPGPMKVATGRLLERLGLSERLVSLNVGNLLGVALKPA